MKLRANPPTPTPSPPPHKRRDDVSRGKFGMDVTANELYARNPKITRYGTETISFLSLRLWSLILQNIKDSSCLPCYKIVLQNQNLIAHVVYSKHFCSILVLCSSAVVLPSQFLIYLKFILPVQVHITYCL